MRIVLERRCGLLGNGNCTNEMGEGLARHFDMLSATERDVKELLVAFDIDDDDMGH